MKNTKLFWSYILLLCLLFSSAAFSFTAKETEQGKQFYQLVKQHLPLMNDPISEDYIHQLGLRLVSFSVDRQETFHFFIVKSSEINAFAGPAGYIGINAGLIIATHNESELASVLAHEIAHVLQHHLNRGNDRMKQLVWPSVAAIAAGIATGIPAVAAGSLLGVTAGDAQYGINVTRSYEKEADAIGIKLLAKAGFNPNAMATFFGDLQTASRYDASSFPLLQTHPVNQARIAIAQSRASHYPKKTYHSSQDYLLVKARMVAEMSGDPDTLLKQVKNDLDKKPDNVFSQYLYALALADKKMTTKALALLQLLEEANPLQIIFPYTQAEIYLGAKQYKKAVDIIDVTLPYNASNYPLVLLYSDALLRNQQPKKAVAFLTKYQSYFSDRTPYWLAFSQSEADAGNLAYAHIYRAKAYLLQGDSRNAQVQYHIALEQKGNTPVSRAIIHAELKKLKRKEHKHHVQQ